MYEPNRTTDDDIFDGLAERVFRCCLEIPKDDRDQLFESIHTAKDASRVE